MLFPFSVKQQEMLGTLPAGSWCLDCSKCNAIRRNIRTIGHIGSFATFPVSTNISRSVTALDRDAC